MCISKNINNWRLKGLKNTPRIGPAPPLTPQYKVGMRRFRTSPLAVRESLVTLKGGDLGPINPTTLESTDLTRQNRVRKPCLHELRRDHFMIISHAGPHGGLHAGSSVVKKTFRWKDRLQSHFTRYVPWVAEMHSPQLQECPMMHLD